MPMTQSAAVVVADGRTLLPDIDMVIANVAKYTAEANVPTLYMDAEAVAEGKSYEKHRPGRSCG